MTGILLALEALPSRIDDPRDRPSVKEAEAALYMALHERRELRDLIGHTGDIRSVQFSPDSRRVLSVSSDETARLWDVESGKELAVLGTPTVGISSARFDRDGTKVVTDSSNDETVRVWDAMSGKEIAVLRGRAARFSPDGTTVINILDGTVRLWNAVSGEESTRFGNPTDAMSRAEFGPTGATRATIGRENVQLWETAAGREITRLKGPTAETQSISFNYDLGAAGVCKSA